MSGTPRACIAWRFCTTAGQMAADAGSPEAMKLMGSIFEYGIWGVPVDIRQAVKWYRKAANAGVIAAMVQLGEIFGDGEDGLTKDVPQALTWFRRAAQMGSTEAAEHIKELEQAPCPCGSGKNYKTCHGRG